MTKVELLRRERDDLKAEVERLRAERDAFYEGQKGALAEFSRREIHQRTFNAAFDREIERGKTPAEAADIAGRVAWHEGYIRLNRRHFDALAEWVGNHANYLRNVQWASENTPVGDHEK